MKLKLVPRTIPGKILAAICGIVLLLVVIAVAQGASKANLSSDSTSGSSVNLTTAPVATKATTHTVRFVVTGSPADVTYGHGGTSVHGQVPMNVTEALLGSATTYSLDAILGDTGGTVKVKIYIDGTLIAHAKAVGAYQTADVVAAKNPFTDKWESALGG